MAQEAKPSFVGSKKEIELAQRVFDVMLLQGRFFGSDSPIRQSLKQLSDYFVAQGVHKDADELGKQLDAALQKNAQVFFREEDNGDIVYTTTKKGAYRPLVRSRAGSLPVVTNRHMASAAPRSVSVTGPPRPTIIKHGSQMPTAILEAFKELVPPAPVAEAPERPAPAKPPRTRAATQPPAAKPKPKPVPQVVTPAGVTINLAKSPADIIAKHGDYFSGLLRDRLAGDPRFISFGDQWMLIEQMTSIAKGELRQVREALEANGGPATDEALCTRVFNKDAQADPGFRFSLNHQLLNEKKVFEFVGSAQQNLWWLAGASSPRILRASLKPAEIGSDLKYLEDEAPSSAVAGGKWVHTLTFYEWENGILPYSSEAKFVLPPPFLKDQRLAELSFEAPQFGLSVHAELHYPTGNRGGWVEGLAEILVVFLSGVELTIARSADKVNTFTITYEAKPAQETTVLLHDAKRQRFVFQSLPLMYQTNSTYLLERSRFGGLKDVRRLDEASRRKIDTVVTYAFEKVGVKGTRDEKSTYRARIEDVLPIINIEKPYSKAALLRYFDTHPQYSPDPNEAGVFILTVSSAANEPTAAPAVND